jgi:pimeloyl-ACP methyl ester carboxylesterase
MHLTIDDTNFFFDVDGPSLELVDGTLRPRRVLIALHGGPGLDHGYLRPDLAGVDPRVQVIWLDLRGQGRSSRPALETCTLERMADDVAAFCERLGIERPVVLGHSAGGFVAMHLALRHPDRLGALVLCSSSPTLAPMHDPAPPPSLAARGGDEAAAIATQMFRGDISPAVLEGFARLVAPHYAGPTHADVPARLFPLSSMNVELVRYFFSELAPHYDVRDRLGEIAAPTLVVVGDHDWVCPPIGSRTIASRLPRATLVELPGVGHFPFAEAPDAFRTALRGFLDALGASAKGQFHSIDICGDG